MAQSYLIDGYNVLHAVSSLEKILEKDAAAARAELEKRVNLYCRSGDITATIVYDSRSVPHAFDDYIDGDQPLVVYTGSVKTADDFIIDEADRLRSPSVTVVTGDKKILSRAIQAGCSTMPPHQFSRIMRKKSKGRQGKMPKKNQTSRLTVSEIQKWLRLFNAKDDEDEK